ncbi:MAG TPA: SgcJ/EcaC family oxidoreductase [Coriobacteriia bacterium]|nr:SgcJ/EcaC family oxidoreductase [Coriobacteriia bacterium]
MNAERGQSARDDEAAVRAVEAAYDAAWNAGDLASLLQLLTERVVIVNPYGEMTIGRDAVETSFNALFDGAARGSTHTSRIRAVHFVAPDVALVDADAVIADFGPGPEPLRHDFTDVLVRTREGWRINHVRAYTFIARPQG